MIKKHIYIVIITSFTFTLCLKKTNDKDVIIGNYCNVTEDFKHLVINRDGTYYLRQNFFGEIILDYGIWKIKDDFIELKHSINLIDYIKLEGVKGKSDSLIINFDHSILNQPQLNDIFLRLGYLKYKIDKSIILDKKDISENKNHINITNDKYCFFLQHYINYDTISISLEKKIPIINKRKSISLKYTKGVLVSYNNNDPTVEMKLIKCKNK